MSSSNKLRLGLSLLAIAAGAVLPGASVASAAAINNGSFETGDLSGWLTHNESGAGDWFVESADEAEGEGWPPPQGNFFAKTFEVGEDTPILYQDVSLEAGYTHRLSMTLYYGSEGEIIVPEPNTLASDHSAPDNQQFRVDVIKPSAPIQSLAPGDILATVFANHTGDPQFMEPEKFSVDLTPFAGQTVRLRLANAVQDAPFSAAADAVSIVSTALLAPPAPAPAPSNAIARGKLTLNQSNGTGKLAIVAPGPGTLVEVGKGKTRKVKKASLAVTAAGTVKLPLNPTGAGKRILNSTGKLKTRIDVTFTPTGGTAATQTYKVTLKKTLKK
jgi:hypothetical protein